jgi:tripartite-type tricarboxylate transporter receptor subunit TctC
MDRRGFLTSAATLVAASAGGFLPALAQTGSSQPIRLIIGAAAGSAMEPYARLVSEHMAKSLGRTMIVEPKVGGGGNIAAQFVADAPADGNLILIGNQGLLEINPSAFSDVKWSLKDFNPLIRGVQAPLVLVTHPSVPAKTLGELIAWVKKNPGKLSYASYSPGTPSHFLGFQLNERFGLDLAHVPYRGSGPQTTDLMAGHALLGFSQIQTTLPHIAAGKLNAIAVTGGERFGLLPNVPTFAELGQAEFTTKIWFGLVVGAGTPAAVAESLLNAAKSAHADPDVRAKLEAQGFEMSGESGPAFAADIRAQGERWARLVKASGFKGDGG